MNKYNDFMSHIRVDDAMHRRVMDAVSRVLDEQQASSEKESAAVTTPVRHRAKISVMKIISIAAAAILVAGGALFIATRFFRGTKNAETISVQHATRAQAETRNAAEYETTVSEEIDAAIGGGVPIARNNGNTKDKQTITAGKDAVNAPKVNRETEVAEPSEEAKAEEDDKTAPENEDREENTKNGANSTYSITNKKTMNTFLPFRIKTVGSTTNRNITAKVYTGVNGEKAILFSAAAGTDLAKNYFPKFKGIPVLLQTQGGQQFYGIDSSVGKNVLVSSAGPFDAVTWTKDGTSYMLAFNSKQDVEVFIQIMENI